MSHTIIPFHIVNGKQVPFTPEELAAWEACNERKLEVERMLKFAAINAKAQELLAPYAADYPQGEVYSWATQVAEAEAYDANPLAATPILSGIAAQRGTTVAHLVTRVKVKANAYATIIGPIIGKRQFFEDLALSAATVAELDAIDITTGWPI